MTRKTRAKIYRQAALIFANGSNVYNPTSPCDRWGLCGVLKHAIEPPVCFYFIEDGKNLPELSMFNPNNNSAYWYELDDTGDSQRILALLLSEQMALNP